MARDLDIHVRHLGRLAGRPPASAEPTAADDVGALLDGLRQSREEIDRLDEYSADLEASSEQWARLYDANVARANDAEAERDRLASAVLKAANATSEQVAALTQGLETLVRLCDNCGRGRLGQQDEIVCRRCELAMAALSGSASRVAAVIRRLRRPPPRDRVWER